MISAYPDSRGTCVRVDLHAIAHNVRAIRRELGEQAAGQLHVAAMIPGCYRWLRMDGGRIVQAGPEMRHNPEK